MNKLKLIIADDEPAAREGLQALVRSDDEIELAGSCKNGVEAIEVIETIKPDIILLDIQMPEVSGFDVVRSITLPWPQIIFITAYDQYAIQAFEHHALDYLLKPFSDERFYKSLTRAKQMVRDQHTAIRSNQMMELLRVRTGEETTLIGNEATAHSLQKLVVKDSGKIILIPWGEIACIKADDYTVRIHYSGKIIVVRETLKKLETILPPSQFIRTHKSYMVNITKIREIENDISGGLILKLGDNFSIPVSKNYKNILNNIFGIS
ncbi:MAG TPA: LytTR family DNA-binding domain-containing protein [Cyclobacteriaceae bacterium]